MFHTIVVVGASLAGACGPQVAGDDAGAEDSSSAASSGAGSASATSGPGTSAATNATTGTSTGTTGVTSVTTTGPDTVTSFSEVGSDGSCPPDEGCKLDIPAPKFDLAGPAGPYECCWGTPCSDDLVCDQNGLFCTAYCMDAGIDCPPAPADDAQPACVQTGGGPAVCMLDCSAGETCPPGFECVQWSGMQSVCSPVCVVPIA